MDIRFLTPLAAFAGFAALLPLAVLVFRQRRCRIVEQTLGLEPGITQRRTRAQRFFHSYLSSGMANVAALVALFGLLALAGTQPVLLHTESRYARSDAQVYIVFDTSRSMLASQSPGGATRLERAKDVAASVREAVPEIPMGTASWTNQFFSHLLPSTDVEDFLLNLSVININQPPPAFSGTYVSTLAGIEGITTMNFFDRNVKKRVMIFMTDGEVIQGFTGEQAAMFRRAGVQVILVHTWNRNEKIFTFNKGVETEYRTDPDAIRKMRRFSLLTGAPLFNDGQKQAIAQALRRDVGSGPSVKVGEEQMQTPLMPLIVLACVLPLLFLFRRNMFFLLDATARAARAVARYANRSRT